MPTVEIRMPDEEKEGTQASLGAWLRNVGDTVVENEPIVEISTDKVTLEIAAPVSGVLVSVAKQGGETVEPGDLLGAIELGGVAATVAGAPAAAAESKAQGDAATGQAAQSPSGPAAGADATLSPVTRRLLEELGLEAAAIPKTSGGTRITPADIAAYLSAGGDPCRTGKGQPQQPAATEQAVQYTGRLIPHSPMRKAIATHMARSVQTAPHVTALFEADMGAVFADRESRKSKGAEAPSVTAYIIHAAIRCIKLVPEVNSKWHDAHLEMFNHVNFGVGTALDTGGLVVPVIRDADQMDLLTLSTALRLVTAKAREGKLTQADMEGGTFTLSNHGVSGSLMASPIILPHGQAAILGAGKVQKRVVVCETGGRELFRIRPMMYVTLTVDHRVLDGQHANGYMSAFVKALETPEQA